jgi:hypothetical protein
MLNYIHTYICNVELHTKICNVELHTYICNVELHTYICNVELHTYICNVELHTYICNAELRGVGTYLTLNAKVSKTSNVEIMPTAPTGVRCTPRVLGDS